MTTIVVTGPESTGKTTLARDLAESFSAPVVAEAARAYLDERDLIGSYQPGDLLRIAHLQRSSEQAASNANELVICDTDLQVVSVWWAERFGPAPASLQSAYAAQSDRYYLLCRPDIEWEPDPQRESRANRSHLFNLYEEDLVARQLKYSEVCGHGRERIELALSHCRRWLSAT